MKEKEKMKVIKIILCNLFLFLVFSFHISLCFVLSGGSWGLYPLRWGVGFIMFVIIFILFTVSLEMLSKNK